MVTAALTGEKPQDTRLPAVETWQVRISRGLLARNSTYNFLGQLSSATISLVALPYVIPRLGPERYGVFALIWTLIEYFSVFEFGVGAATTKFVAEAIGRNENDRVQTIFHTSLLTVFVLGSIGSVACLLIAPLLANSVFNISLSLTEEARAVFSISAGLVTAILVRSVLNGLLEAYQRFDLINAVKIPSNILTALIPLVTVSLGFGLRVIVLLILLKETVFLFGYYSLCVRQMPRARSSIDFRLVKSVLCFGGWLCLIRSLGLLMLSLEPFFIGALVTVEAVTFYTIPYKLTGAMLMLPSSIMVVLYPAFSLLNAVDDEKMKRLFSVSLKYVTAILGLPVLILALFPKEILVAWLGADFEVSATAMRLLAIGMLFSGTSWLFGTLMTGTGYPKVTAILGLIQAPLYVLASWLLIRHFGVNGAATGWAAQKCLGVLLLYVACRKLGLVKFSWREDIVGEGRLLWAMLLLVCMVAVSLVGKHVMGGALAGTVANISLLTVLYIILAWRYVVEPEQKVAIVARFRLINSSCRVRAVRFLAEHWRRKG